MRSAVAMVVAALFEIVGCFAFWAWLRLGASPWWLPAGIVALIAFATILTLVDTALSGRAFAAYGGVYIATALAWLHVVEQTRPDRWDLLGAGICLIGAMVIALAPRD